MKLQKKIEKQICTLKFEGTIDEDADFSVVGELKSSKIIFDLESISFINSCGIREWVDFIEKIPPDTEITYIKCPQIFVEQMNMVKGMVPAQAEVESFYAPYYSEKLDQVFSILLMTKEIKNMRPPEQSDKETGELLEFDDIEEQYFSFLKNSD